MGKKTLKSFLGTQAFSALYPRIKPFEDTVLNLKIKRRLPGISHVTHTLSLSLSLLTGRWLIKTCLYGMEAACVLAAVAQRQLDTSIGSSVPSTSTSSSPQLCGVLTFVLHRI